MPEPTTRDLYRSRLKADLLETQQDLDAAYFAQYGRLCHEYPQNNPHTMLDQYGRPILADLLVSRAQVLVALANLEGLIG